MYLSFYGLTKHPFHITPDPAFLFLSPSHQDALGSFMYGIERRKGFVTIIGEVGVGKTTILRAYLEGGHHGKEKTIYIFNPNVTFHGLLTTIFRNLELVPISNEVVDMVNQLHEFLIAEYQSGGTVVLVIDEAQNMPIETLENMRMLSNLETSTDKLIQVILIGQPELATMLKKPALRQLTQRLAIRTKINPLTPKESQEYIEHRVAQVAKQETQLFTSAALKLIIKHAKGIPRRLNILCDNALITGFGYESNPVTAAIVKEVINDIDDDQPYPAWKWAAGIAAALLVFGIIYWMVSIPAQKDPLSVPPPTASLQTAQSTNGGLMEPEDEEKMNPVMGSDDKTALVASKAIVQQSKREEEVKVEDSTVEMEMQAKKNSPQHVDVETTTPLATTSSDTKPKAIFSQAAEKENVEKENQNIEIQKQIGKKDSQPEMTESLALVSNSDQLIDPTNESPVIKIVKKGEILSGLMLEIYGYYDPQSIEWVRMHNPDISDPNVILSGQTIVFPTKTPGS